MRKRKIIEDDDDDVNIDPREEKSFAPKTLGKRARDGK
jgi:hypothetical protein